jgi:diguanylate cyclase (GGDEF)-like protein
VAPDHRPTIQPAELLDALRARLEPLPFRLSVACAEEDGSVTPCGALGQNSLCAAGCRAEHEAAMRSALAGEVPTVFRCASGLLNFAVPFRDDRGRACCLLGGGVREAAPALSALTQLSNAATSEGGGLIERFDDLPAATAEEAASAATAAAGLIPALLEKNLYAAALEKTSRRLASIAEVAAACEAAPDERQVLALLAEALVVLFDLCACAVLLEAEGGATFTVPLALGTAPLPEPLATSQIRDALGGQGAGRPAPLPEALASHFPGLDPDRALGLPLAAGGAPFGLLVITGGELARRDWLLIELLAGRAAARLERLRREGRARLESARYARLAAMVGALSLAASGEELHRQTVALAAELLEAADGSLMLLDDGGETLRIVAAKGLSPALARTMSVRLGEGIAGRVARNGFPLLVTDIEKDGRTAILNRPRFRTKSFLSVPLKLKGQTVGVLNLADKESGAAFSEADLELLTAFADHAAAMLERTAALERTSLLEELAVTDPLTGLYNRRFLERRLDEELNRSRRQKLAFSVILIDLDHFKLFNDRGGHLAGDQALKRAADLLRASAREMDIVARYGGEEFCIVLPATSKKESILVAERIRRAIEREPFPHEAELPEGRLTASLGVAAFPEDGSDAAALLGAADLALYQAKGDGRNRIVLCGPALLALREGSG